MMNKIVFFVPLKITSTIESHSTLSQCWIVTKFEEGNNVKVSKLILMAFYQLFSALKDGFSKIALNIDYLSTYIYKMKEKGIKD